MNDSTVNRYLNRVQYKYNTLKFKKFSFKFLRFLQVMGGFAITTMTTYNNPYFKENSDKVRKFIKANKLKVSETDAIIKVFEFADSF